MQSASIGKDNRETMCLLNDVDLGKPGQENDSGVIIIRVLRTKEYCINIRNKAN